MTEPDYVPTDRAHWDTWAHAWVAGGEAPWASERSSGEWRTREDMSGMDAIELGCGTG